MTLIDERTGRLDRFRAPLYTVAETSRYLGVPQPTLRRWTHADIGLRPAVVTAVARQRSKDPVIPFIGMAEALVLAAMRHSGVPLQRIRPALNRLSEEFGLDHALASKRLYTDGAEVLYDYSQTADDPDSARAARELVVVRNKQGVFNDVVSGYLRRLEFDRDGYARLIRLPGYEVADVVVDATRSFGQPLFSRGGARVEDVLALFNAGESLDVVADEYGVPHAELEDVIRRVTRRAA